ncbi:phage tail tube protein [Wolbachia endosymbiont of Ctenocephalides felis wCfeT]|uniref:phage tail tube protein n=1 Tax=Wolbachia endosymbiont of Ctenocephalides felis wCfeT TaxID=2732593 RepID=UPI001447F531|nr:phage tail tube protein [Wolbachia endosymbiont of Ctenocephalides felis wCfeT]
MNKLRLKIKDNNNNFVVLNNIKNLRFTLSNNKEEIKDIPSLGWRKVLDCAGNRHITIKINGILDSILADELLRNSAMINSVNDYEIDFNIREKVKLRCSIELYERYYDTSAFDSFTVVLASSEIVGPFH